jgi:hypothetical protein
MEGDHQGRASGGASLQEITAIQNGSSSHDVYLDFLLVGNC